MKISLAWAFDHIDADRHKIDINQLVNRFNETTAEIEGWTCIEPDLASLALATITEMDSEGIGIYVPEYDVSTRLPYRADVKTGLSVFVRKDGADYSWACMKDFGSSKDFLLPMVHVDEAVNPRNWRESIEVQDYIVEIDNKSITHRPDMWGHRGFAREIAAFYDLPLKPLNSFLASVEIQEFTGSASQISQTAPTLTIKETNACKKLASAFISTVSWSPSRITLLARLCRVESRPIDALVDMTNYVMFDLGQPMHAFDAERVRDNQVTVRMAEVGETLKLLDGDTIELTPRDCILVDSRHPISLAGVMGGYESSVTSETRSLLLESGNFNSTMVRLTAAHHKKRTDAAMRFEKSLDPNQTVYAVRRFMRLLNEHGIAHTSDGHVVVVGPKALPLRIEVSHSYIETRLGVSLEPSFVIRTLEKLAFEVNAKETGGGAFYDIIVPTFRATKDIALKEDIVEEVGRFFGYSNVKLRPSLCAMKPTSLYDVYKQRDIKRLFARSLHMHELSSYAFFDESWLRELSWDPGQTVEATQPVSANWRRLITTLAPSLFKAIKDNVDHHKKLRFFEWGRVWHKEHTVREDQQLAGILFDQQGSEDFYTYKLELERVFEHLRMPIEWRRAQDVSAPWFIPYKTAELVCEGRVIGHMGMIDAKWHEKCAPSGTLCLFELDGTFLRSYKPAITQFTPLLKFPTIERDISMLLPLSVTAQEVCSTIKSADSRIISVVLHDFFQKEEWDNKKSLMFNFVISDKEKTLTSQEADDVCAHVTRAVQALGAEVR